MQDSTLLVTGDELDNGVAILAGAVPNQFEITDVHADGLYINPVIGPKKAGDFLADPILKSY